jgi:DNA-binding NarL/FixJ family response regulator
VFPLMDRQSFARPDAPTPSGHGITRGGVAAGSATAVSPAVPAARSPHADRPAGVLVTPANGLNVAGEHLSVLLVDAEPTRREVVAQSLVTAGAGHVLEVGSVDEARARVRSGPPCELAVVGLDLADGGALALVAELRAQGWRTVVLGRPDDPAGARAAFDAGALAYLLTSPSSPLGAMSRRFLEPEVPAVAPRLAGGSRVVGVDDTACELSPREVQVLQSVADGHSNHEIGEALGLSALTVKSHLSRIGRKLGTGDRARMVVLAMRAGVVR